MATKYYCDICNVKMDCDTDFRSLEIKTKYGGESLREVGDICGECCGDLMEVINTFILRREQY